MRNKSIIYQELEGMHPLLIKLPPGHLNVVFRHLENMFYF